MTFQGAATALGGVGAKQVLRSYFSETSCINSSRVMQEVFRRLGLESSPMVVRAMVFSPGFIRKVEEEGRYPDSVEELKTWTREPGVYSVGIGFGGIELTRDQYPGHLVLRVGEHGLYDATISQASRRYYGIWLPELLAISNVPEAFWQGEESIVHCEQYSRCTLRYQARPDDNSYLGSGGWNLRPGIEEAACLEILNRLKSGVPHEQRHRAGRFAAQKMRGVENGNSPRVG